ncbi:DUF2505 domain-containing protein [Acidipropionibacterium jensenii]|uniref:DUF2505 domain-containing protein n=1 Tax=Acidipropionibacterium jensenii TaxID=1749 RepID=UPI00264910C9|nr:DUF2505 domain-containing protein [Acidipropionibacterium jensenii]MDN6591293.1 DUF2505 domain-containing protein [Acidipropionibacterium jensenii]
MDINTSAQFAADPNTVCAMMTDPSWWQDVYRRIGATTSDVTVTDTGLSLDLALPAPSQVKKFVGETMAAHQDLSWGPAADDGSRKGTLTITPKGLPAKAVGHADLAGGGPGSVITYTGEFTVSIPLVGRKLESTAGPYITRAFDVQQEAGNDYLSARSAQ